MKGYKTSKNYELLWKLIKDGFRVPAWINRNVRDELKAGKKTYDLVEVKLLHGDYYLIGTRGIGYEDAPTKEGFLKSCKFYQLKFVLPTK